MKKLDVVIGGGCRRNLDPEVYSVTLTNDISEDKITHVYDPNHYKVTVQCANCGHYTVHSPYKPAEV